MTRREEINQQAEEYRQPYRDGGYRLSSKDIRDAFEEGAEWMQEKMIEKACEVLKNHLFTQVVDRYDGEYSQFIQEVYTQVFPKFATAEDMIMVLRKEMEE